VGKEMKYKKTIGRTCVACDSTTTYRNKLGIEKWVSHDGNWFCHKCYDKYIHNPVYHVNCKEWNDRNNKNDILFKGKSIQLKYNPRKGQCTKCNLKIGDLYINCEGKWAVLKRTCLHHIEYHDDDPLKDTIELCVACHRRTHLGR